MWRRSILVYLCFLLATTPFAWYGVFVENHWTPDDRAISVVFWVTLWLAAAAPIIVGNVLVRSWDRTRFGISFVLFSLAFVLAVFVASHFYLAMKAAHIYERWGLHPFAGENAMELYAFIAIDGVVCLAILPIVAGYMFKVGKTED